MVSAKVQLAVKEETGLGRQVRLSFVPDYAAGRNEEWALNTPSLSLNMVVKAEVAELFEPQQSYTLLFVPETSQEED